MPDDIPIKLGHGADAVLHGGSSVIPPAADLDRLGGSAQTPAVDAHAKAVLDGGPPAFGPHSKG